MTNPILAVDVGHKHTGICLFFDEATETHGSFATESYRHFYTELKDRFRLYKPSIVVVGKPNRYYNVIAIHNRYIGILCLLAEKHKIPLVELNDMTARAAVFKGKGGAKKEEIMKLTGIDDPDANDAYVLAKAWYLLNL